MKKSKKIFLRVLPVLMLAVMLISSNFVFADKAGFGNFTGDMKVNADTSGNTVKSIGAVWGIILTVLQVAAIAAVVFAGVRYMFASADSKADLKKGLIHLAIGMVIVFGASSVVGFVTGAFDDIFRIFLKSNVV